jgi:hypothetical protein
MSRDEAIIQSMNELSEIRERLLQFTYHGVYRKGNVNDLHLGRAIDKTIAASDALLEAIDDIDLLED